MWNFPGKKFQTEYDRVDFVSQDSEVPGRGTWVNVCWVCAAGLSEPLPHYAHLSHFLGNVIFAIAT